MKLNGLSILNAYLHPTFPPYSQRIQFNSKIQKKYIKKKIKVKCKVKILKPHIQREFLQNPHNNNKKKIKLNNKKLN